jgi:DNA-binding NtrC family response regulator
VQRVRVSAGERGARMPRRILVADDDKAMLNIYTRIFTGTDYLISQASGFAEAARLINSGNYDLLITDLLLGDGLGTELIRLFEKKKTGARSLLVTGSVAELAPEQLPETYFEKPFKVEVFMAAVTKALA